MTDKRVEAAAQAIASELYDGFDAAFADKCEWIDARGEKAGRYRDVNEPFQSDYLAAAQAALAAADAVTWQPIETALKDCDVLVWYDHEADPYQDPLRPGRLTDYGANAEGGEFLDGAGVAIAKWSDQVFEPEDEYGNGYWLPAGWFSRGDNDDYETVCNATHWRPLPAPPAVKP